MRPTISLIRREFTAYFQSPIAYVVLTVFLFGTGFLYMTAFDSLTAHGPRGAESPIGVILGDGSDGVGFPIFWLMFLFVPPLLTMRLFAEERGSGTMEMLMTAPIRDWQIVLAKFVAAYAFYLVMWLPTIAYLPTLLDLHCTWNGLVWTPYSIILLAGALVTVLGLLTMIGVRVGIGFLVVLLGLILTGVGLWLHLAKDKNRLIELTAGIDPWPVATSYIGVLAVGVMFLSLGLLVSSLVKGQMVAALVSIATGAPLLLSFLALAGLDPSGMTHRIFSYVAVPYHFGRDFTRGVVDTRHLVFYLSAGLLFLFLTVRSVESQRR